MVPRTINRGGCNLSSPEAAYSKGYICIYICPGKGGYPPISPGSYRLITHKFKVDTGDPLRSLKTRDTKPPRCVLHTTTA